MNFIDVNFVDIQAGLLIWGCLRIYEFSFRNVLPNCYVSPATSGSPKTATWRPCCFWNMDGYGSDVSWSPVIIPTPRNLCFSAGPTPGLTQKSTYSNCRGSSLSLTVSQITRLGCFLRTYCVRQLIVKILEVSDFLIGPCIRFFWGVLVDRIGMWRKTACGSFVIGTVLKALQMCSLGGRRRWLSQGLADMQFRRKKTVKCSGPCRYAV